MRVGILAYSLVSAGGYDVTSTFQSLLARRDTRSDFGSKKAHLVSIGSGVRPQDRLENIAFLAADALSYQEQADTVLVGSTSDSFTARELGESSIPSLSRSLKKRYYCARSFQFSNACASSSTAIAIGAELIRQKKAEVVIAGGADEVCQSVIDAFDAVRIYGDRCQPFDVNRRGLVLGEAAAFIVMAREGIGEPIAYLDGAGLRSDAMDVAAMDKRSIVAAITDSTRHRGYISDVDLVMAHGTGTKENDKTEVEAIDYLWAMRERQPAVVSYKGGLGHPQGASGAVGVALVLEAMRLGAVFPTVGCDTPDPELHFEMVRGPIHMPVKSAIVLSHGTWGISTSLYVRSA